MRRNYPLRLRLRYWARELTLLSGLSLVFAFFGAIVGVVGTTVQTGAVDFPVVLGCYMVGGVCGIALACACMCHDRCKRAGETFDRCMRYYDQELKADCYRQIRKSLGQAFKLSFLTWPIGLFSFVAVMVGRSLRTAEAA